MEEITVALVSRDGTLPGRLSTINVHLVREPSDITSSDDVILFYGERMAEELICFSQGRRKPPAPAVFLAPWLDRDDVSTAFDHGAVSYLIEPCRDCLLAEAIACAPHGASILDPSIAAEQVRTAAQAMNLAAQEGHLDRLSPREQQIMRLLVMGFNVREITDELHLREKTVRNYLSNIYEKLDVHSRSQAILHWIHSDSV